MHPEVTRTAAEDHPRLGRRSLLLLTLTTVAGIALFGWMWCRHRQYEHRHRSFESRLITEQIRYRLEDWIAFHVDEIAHLDAVTGGMGPNGPLGFRERAARVVERTQGFQALNWVDPDGVIRIIVPEAGNEKALGVDLAAHTEPGVADAVRRAKSSDGIVRTPAIDLLQGGRGLATYRPTRDDEGRLLGFVNGVIRIETIVDRCLAEADLREGFRYTLTEADGVVAYAHATGTDTAPDGWAYRTRKLLDVVGRPWFLDLAPRPDRLEDDGGLMHDLPFFAGLLATALLVILLRAHLRRRESLRQSEALYRSVVTDVVDALNVGIIALDSRRRVVWLNRAHETYFGLQRESLLGEDIRRVIRAHMQRGVLEHPEKFARRVFAPATDSGTTFEFHVLPAEHREERWLEHRSQPIRSGLFKGGRIDHFRDVTRRRQAEAEQAHLEAQLRQAQKMEAVGKLAGGVAHDFNNILQVILGRSHLLLRQEAFGSPDQEAVSEVIKAAERAAALTRQLLAFGRRQVLERRVLDVNRLVTRHVQMLQRMIGEDIELELALGDDAGWIEADRTQVEQILMNLCVNAREAMPDGGRLTISTRRMARSGDGHDVEIAVTDEGVGIAKERLDRVFEPFYSTKDPSEGSGLGLSTVYGIASQHGGRVEIDSREGEGTTVRVLLPASDPAAPPLPEEADAADAHGTETILVVEDNERVRVLVLDVLRAAGYHVIEAADGRSALRVVEEGDAPIDLLFSDVVMPNMSGAALRDEITASGSSIRVLLTSGYSADTLGVEPGEREEDFFLEGDALGAGEGHGDTEVGGAFGDEGLGAEERVDRELDPAAVVDEVLFEQGVVDVVAGVTLVTGEIDGAVDVDREVGVDLDEAVEAALVPVVATPGFVGDVLDLETLVRREVDVEAGLLASLLDRGAEDGVELVDGNDELVAEGLVAGDEAPLAGQEGLELIEDGLEVLVGVRRSDGVVEGERFLVEGHVLAFEDLGA